MENRFTFVTNYFKVYQTKKFKIYGGINLFKTLLLVLFVFGGIGDAIGQSDIKNKKEVKVVTGPTKKTNSKKSKIKEKDTVGAKVAVGDEKLDSEDKEETDNIEFKLYQITNNTVFEMVRSAKSLVCLNEDNLKKVRRVKRIFEMRSDIDGDINDNSAEKDSRFYLEVWRNKKRVSLSSVDFSGVKINEYDFSESGYYEDQMFFVFTLKELGDKVGKDELVVMDIVLKSGKVADSFGIFYNNVVELYGWGGFWVPTNMYSFTGKSDENGIEVGVYPIAGAWGSKFRWGRGMRYIGTSFSVNPGYTSNADNNSIFINSLSIGPVIDLGGIAYLGYHKGIDLTAGNSQKPDDRFIVGFSLKLVSIFVNGKKE